MLIKERKKLRNKPLKKKYRAFSYLRAPQLIAKCTPVPKDIKKEKAAKPE